MILGFKDGKIKSIINGIKIKTDLESNQMLFQQIWKRTKVPWYAYKNTAYKNTDYNNRDYKKEIIKKDYFVSVSWCRYLLKRQVCLKRQDSSIPCKVSPDHWRFLAVQLIRKVNKVILGRDRVTVKPPALSIGTKDKRWKIWKRSWSGLKVTEKSSFSLDKD